MESGILVTRELTACEPWIFCFTQYYNIIYFCDMQLNLFLTLTQEIKYTNNGHKRWLNVKGDISINYHLWVSYVKERNLGIWEGLVRYMRLTKLVYGWHCPPPILEVLQESNTSLLTSATFPKELIRLTKEKCQPAGRCAQCSVKIKTCHWKLNQKGVMQFSHWGLRSPFWSSLGRSQKQANVYGSLFLLPLEYSLSENKISQNSS